MKHKILKYNLIPLAAAFALSMIYSIGFVLHSLMIEIKFGSGEYGYRSVDMNGPFFSELYGEEWSLGYMLWAGIVSAAVTVVILLFYRKALSRIPFTLLGLSAVFGPLIIAIPFIFQSILLLSAALIAGLVYMISAIGFVIKDFKEMQ